MTDLLLGLGGVEYAHAGLRIAVGLFFALSGAHKLLSPERNEALAQTLTDLKIPMVEFNRWFVPVVEAVAGTYLIFGFLTLPSAVALAVICLVACITDGPRRVEAMQPMDEADRVDDWLYLVEVTYLLILIFLVAAGPGPFSFDYLFFAR